MKEMQIENKFRERARTMTDENIHTFPKEVQELYRFNQENKDKVLFPKKYYAAQKDAIRLQVKQLWKNDPGRPARQIMQEVLGSLPDIIPADKLAELMKFAATEWQKLQKKEAEMAS